MLVNLVQRADIPMHLCEASGKIVVASPGFFDTIGRKVYPGELYRDAVKLIQKHFEYFASRHLPYSSDRFTFEYEGKKYSYIIYRQTVQADRKRLVYSSGFDITCQAELVERLNAKKIESELLQLSKRECEIACCISRGMPTKEIAQKLFLSVATVERHRANIRKKLGLTDADVTLYDFFRRL